MVESAKGVTVRMYRQGLGDCFLLSFPRESRPFYMLIDCGVLLGTVDQNGWMRRVAEDVRRATDGRIDVLIATHEHWDHLSGFLQAEDIFQQITVDELWLAWTENPEHELANRLRKGREAALRALAAAHLRLQAAAPEDALALAGVLEFSGPLDALGAGGRPTVATALERLREKVTEPRYCRPGGEPITLPGVEGVRIHVLGPPEDEKRLKRSNPTKSGREGYELAASADVDHPFLTAITHGAAPDLLSVDERRAYELTFPFDISQQISLEAAQAHPFFAATYFGNGGQAEDASWRRIEDDWLGAAHDLALKLDNDTNNTSLALAIELAPGGDVLLFPGDAQVGNWLSWGDLVWPQGAREGDPGALTARDLLERTVLYKVGHHASHNATLREEGLELMASPDLVAMIPVDETMRARRRSGTCPSARCCAAWRSAGAA